MFFNTWKRGKISNAKFKSFRNVNSDNTLYITGSFPLAKGNRANVDIRWPVYSRARVNNGRRRPDGIMLIGMTGNEWIKDYEETCSVQQTNCGQ